MVEGRFIALEEVDMAVGEEEVEFVSTVGIDITHKGSGTAGLGVVSTANEVHEVVMTFADCDET